VIDPPRWAAWCRPCGWASAGRSGDDGRGTVQVETEVGDAEWPWEGARLLARLLAPGLSWRPEDGACRRCAQPARERAVVVRETQSWEADLCRACGLVVVLRRLRRPAPTRLDVGQQWVPPDRGVILFVRLFL
jgi:hypothetical protein